MLKKDLSMVHVRMTEEELTDFRDIVHAYKNKLKEKEKSMQFLARQFILEGIEKHKKILKNK